MQYIVADLEWNGAFSKKAHGYFNEIIEIGAVKLDSQLQPAGRFHAMIKPVVSRKLSDIVTDLTSITEEELERRHLFAGGVPAPPLDGGGHGFPDLEHDGFAGADGKLPGIFSAAIASLL